MEEIHLHCRNSGVMIYQFTSLLNLRIGCIDNERGHKFVGCNG